MAPLTHGAAATGLAWAVVAAISIVDKAAKDRSVPILTLAALGVVSVSFGMIGAYVTFRRELRQAPPET